MDADITNKLKAINGYLNAFPSAFTHAATLGGDDYLSAAADHPLSGQPYMDRVAAAHARRADQEAEHPVASTIGSLLGSVLNTPKALMGSAGKAALTNGVMGGVQGALDSEGNVGSTLAQGGISAALPGVITKAGGLANRVVHAGEGASESIGEALRRLLGGADGPAAAMERESRAMSPYLDKMVADQQGPLSNMIDRAERPADRAARLESEGAARSNIENSLEPNQWLDKDGYVRGQGPDVDPSAKPKPDRVADIVRLHADRSASDAGERAAGSPARSFSEMARSPSATGLSPKAISKDSDVSNVYPFPVPDANYQPTHNAAGMPLKSDPVPPKAADPWTDSPYLPENMVNQLYDPANHGNNLDDYLVKPYIAPGSSPSDTSKSMLDALTGQARSAARWAGSQFEMPKAEAAPTAYDKSHPTYQYTPIPGSDVDATQAIDDYKRRQVPLPDNLTRDSYKKFEFPLPDDITVDSYKKYETPPLRDDLKYDDYKKYLDPSLQ